MELVVEAPGWISESALPYVEKLRVLESMSRELIAREEHY